MTITRSATSTAFQRFIICVDNSPEGTFDDAKDIRKMIGDLADDLIISARMRGLDVCNSDGMFNLEIEVYGYLRAKNEDRFLGAEGYGKTYDEADEALRERINRGLTNDRDFLEKMRIEQAVEREALPYTFAAPGAQA